MIRPRRIAAVVAIALAASLGVVFAAALLVLLVPTLVLNEPVLRKVAAWSGGGESGVRIDWDRIDVAWDVTGFLGRRVRIDFEGLEVEMPDTGGTAQPGGSMSFAYDLRHVVPRLREIGPIHLAEGRTSVRMAQTDDAEADPPADDERGGLPAWLADVELRDIAIDDQAWTVTLQEAVLSGVLDARSRESGDGGIRIDIHNRHRLTGEGAAHTATLEATAVSADRRFILPWDGPGGGWEAEARLELEEGDLGTGSLRLGAVVGGDAIDWQVSGVWAHDAGDAVVEAGGRWSSDRLTGRIDAKASPARPVGPVGRPQLRVAECGFDWQAAGARQTLRVDCPVRVDAGEGPDAALPAGVHPLLALGLALEVRARRPFDAMAPLEARVEITPQELWLVRADGSVRASGTVVPGQGPAQADAVVLEVDVDLQLPRFQALVETLSGSEWAIPAPLHSLEGPVSAKLRGSGAAPEFELAASFGTRLRSEHQHVLVDLDARLKPVGDWVDGAPRRASLTADLLLRDVLLRLPPLEGGVPAVVPDARIQPELERPETARGEGPLHYSVRVSTAPGEAMEISIPVAGEPVPIEADIEAESGGPTRGRIAIGEVSVEAAGIERDIEGGQLYLQLSEVTEAAQGELAVDGADRRIDMTLAQMSGLFSPLPEPKPPLALAQIVTALLIGSAVDVAVVSRTTPTEAPSEPGAAPTSLEFQFRY